MNDAQNLRSIGKFHLIAELGHGGMAKVYLALMAGPAGFNKLMVVKVLRNDLSGAGDEGVRMFWDEARLTAQMVHPNIVHTYEVGEVDGRYYLAMEYLDGQTYRAVQMRSEDSGGLPLREDLRILAETARGLHYAHGLCGYDGEALGVVHRDVSPQNVFITYDGQVKLLDFGIAKARTAENMTAIGVIKGKIDYIAPEQLRGDPIDGRADVFALGAMLWEAITKQRFAGGRKIADIAKAHRRIEGAEPNVRMLKPDVSEELAEIVDKALALSPADRYQSAAELGDALEAYLEAHEPKTSAKTLAAVLAPLFIQERAMMRKLIDQHVQLTQSGLVELGEATGDLPRIDLPDQRTSSGFFAAPPTNARAASGGLRRDLIEATQSASRIDQPSAAPRTRQSFVVALVLAAAAGATVSWLVPRGVPSVAVMGAEPPPTRTAGVPEPAPMIAQPPVAAEPGRSPMTRQEVLRADSVIVDLKVSPADARVTLDGAPLPLPLSGEFPKSAEVHQLEASADGHRPLRRALVFDHDQRIELVLVPASGLVPAARAPVPPTPAAPDAPELAGEAPAPPVAPAPSAPDDPGFDAVPRGRVMGGAPRPYSAQE